VADSTARSKVPVLGLAQMVAHPSVTPHKIGQNLSSSATKPTCQVLQKYTATSEHPGIGLLDALLETSSLNTRFYYVYTGCSPTLHPNTLHHPLILKAPVFCGNDCCTQPVQATVFCHKSSPKRAYSSYAPLFFVHTCQFTKSELVEHGYTTSCS